jgi:hypothetical protein
LLSFLVMAVRDTNIVESIYSMPELPVLLTRIDEAFVWSEPLS